MICRSIKYGGPFSAMRAVSHDDRCATKLINNSPLVSLRLCSFVVENQSIGTVEIIIENNLLVVVNTCCCSC